MARHTRRSRATGHTQENFNENFGLLPCTTHAGTPVGLRHNVLKRSQPDANIKACKKRALSADVSDISTALTPVVPANSAKHAQRISSSHARPLNSTREQRWSKREEAWDIDDGDLDDPAAEDRNVEIGEEWIDDEDVVGFVQKHSSELSDSEEMMFEPSVGGSTQANSFTRVGIPRGFTAMRLPKSEAGVPTAELSGMTTFPEPSTWPADTDLLFPRGTYKLRLSMQEPLLRDIIRLAFDNVQAYLMFRNAFPDADLELSFIKDSILAAARAHRPDAGPICERLDDDRFYMSQIIPLPRERVLLFRNKVKERCRVIVAEAISAISPPSEIARFVGIQLSNYNYMFQTTNPNGHGHVMRSRPYRNDRIIRVIRELYFTGGSSSFAARFEHLFRRTQGHGGGITYEVPVPMVALVVTGLRAALSEWRNGCWIRANFSTNACSSVYREHVRIFDYIRDHRESAFHYMMADIYTDACPGPGGTLTFPIANLNYDELE